ncbi:hypothetical protein DPEC_G00250060 [Dallia pectoralis]|uniref:Uncharacterized protein n=1 Tax=Dallia pectoralis TaxID=75939 RepID=A0ACC2FSQ5_DALPE|nr:hypothetical protein DPEC_G00250060 [Dallia pectoralis]
MMMIDVQQESALQFPVLAGSTRSGLAPPPPNPRSTRPLVMSCPNSHRLSSPESQACLMRGQDTADLVFALK